MPNNRRSDTEYLTGIRGLAAIFVVVAHCSNFGIHVIPGVDLHYTAKAGVWVFFTLSAYLLTGKLELYFSKYRPTPALLEYMKRRILRIYPLYLTFIAVMFLTHAMTGSVSIQHLILVRGDEHLWTIPVEVYFYVLLPIICATVLSRPREQRFAASCGIMVASVAIYVAADPFAISQNSINLLNYLPFFVSGIALYFAPDLPTMNKSAWPMFLISVIGLIASSPRSLMTFGLTLEQSLSMSIFYALFVPLCMYSASKILVIKTVLGSAPFQILGFCSFALYLFHYEIARSLSTANLDDNIKGITAVALSVTVAIFLSLLDKALSERALRTNQRIV